MGYLLDTSACIAVLRNHPHALARLRLSSPNECFISTVTSYELFTGIEKCAQPAQERAKVETLLFTVVELPLDAHAAREASRIRVELESPGTTIGPYDLLIAGHARAARLTLVTSNVGEFSRVAGIAVEDWLNPVVEPRLPSA